MKIFIAADHGGFALKNHLLEFLQNYNIRVEDLGSYSYDQNDDYTDFAEKATSIVLANPESVGIVICRSGIGVDIKSNRHKGIRCGLGYNKEQIIRARGDDDINMLALAADFISTTQAEEIVLAFLNTQPKTEEKYKRRIQKLDQSL
jgi:ribose 5-phosphate isomerase B